MKKLLTILMIAGLFSACTKNDQETLSGPGIKKSDLKFAVTQQSGHDNIIMLASQTPGGYIPYWQYTGGFSKKMNDTINLPFAGNYIIYYSIYTAGGPLEDSTTITVSANDPDYFASPMWNELTNGQSGKTWVWAVDVPGGWCYGNGSGAATAPEWWQNGLSYLQSQGVDQDEMTFDLDGSKNYTYTHNGVSTHAIFDLDTLNQTLKITGSDIPLGLKIVYNITKLNDNEMTLVQQGDGWRNLWLFKRKGYTY
jgi:hypothetical protein